MTEERIEEQEQWCRIVQELQIRAGMTINEIAQALDVEPRQVFRWKDGDRPLGMTAVRLYLLHVKRVLKDTVPQDIPPASDKA